VLPRLKKMGPGVPLIILTGYGSIELAVRAIKEGAEHFLTKPIELPVVRVILERLLENRRTHQKQLASLSRQARERVDPFFGTSPAIRRLAEDVRRVLSADSPVLIRGETGTGKGVLARWLHDNSPRADEAFVDLNCANLSPELLESELFGHEKGAFTGAATGKVGLLEVAHRGTVFLDEICDVDPHVQPKLLKILEDKRFRRVGDVRDRHVDIRLIVATNRDPLLLVEQGAFRSDLYFRISTVRLEIPPLRERAEDIPLLARQLMPTIAAGMGRSGVGLSPEAEESLQRYSWPGNIRELRNVLEHAVLLSNGPLLRPSDLRFEVMPLPSPSAGDEGLTLEQAERRHIERALRAEGGHVPAAAKRLGIPRSSLYHKLKRYGIDPSKV
jgi:DNA-binding NtrC family response regulator